MDALEALQDDHRVIGDLFSAYTASAGVKSKEEVARTLIVELSVHAHLEESILFQVAREHGLTLQQLAQRGADLHKLIATTLIELERLLAEPSQALGRETQLDAIVKTLLEGTRRHIQEDTNWLFPALRRALNATELASIGVLIVQGRPTAPRHPPRSAAHAPAVIQL